MDGNQIDDGGYDAASRRRFRTDDRYSPRPPPSPGGIFEGTIESIQSYGAFCSFGPLVVKESGRHQQQKRQRRTWQGLIHISQLYKTRVERVEDVVEINDTVWVKVLDIERQEPANYNPNRNQHVNDEKAHQSHNRYRIKLSMKEVSQDGKGQDLGREREAKEQMATQLETNLNSMIGIGVARDPMERIVLKDSGLIDRSNNVKSAKTIFRGGYTLVDDDEGEPEPDSSATVTDTVNNTYRVAPMGRGRGATLPAWMTSSEGPVRTDGDLHNSRASRKEMGNDDDISCGKYRNDSDDDDYSRHRSSSKKDKKRDSKRHRKKSRHRDRRREKHSHHRHGMSSDDSDAGNSRYDERERRHRKRHKSSGTSHGRKSDRDHSSKQKKKRSRYKDKYERGGDRDSRYRSDKSISRSWASDNSS